MLNLCIKGCDPCNLWSCATFGYEFAAVCTKIWHLNSTILHPQIEKKTPIPVCQTLMGISVFHPLRQKASQRQSLHFKIALVLHAELRFIAYVCLCAHVCRRWRGASETLRVNKVYLHSSE